MNIQGWVNKIKINSSLSYPKLINKKLLTTNLLIYHCENKLNTVDDLANLNLLTVKKIGGG